MNFRSSKNHCDNPNTVFPQLKVLVKSKEFSSTKHALISRRNCTNLQHGKNNYSSTVSFPGLNFFYQTSGLFLGLDQGSKLSMEEPVLS